MTYYEKTKYEKANAAMWGPLVMAFRTYGIKAMAQVLEEALHEAYGNPNWEPDEVEDLTLATTMWRWLIEFNGGEHPEKV